MRKKKELHRQLKNLQGFTSWFVFTLTIAEIVFMVVVLGLAYKHATMAPLGLANTYKTCSGTNCPQNFNGTTNTSALQIAIVNPFYGPTTKDLLEWGARIAPCMRQDSLIFAQLAQVRTNECGIYPNYCETGQWIDGIGVSCCNLTASNRLGMTDKPTCDANFGTWLSNGANQSKLCDESANIVLRPCCLGYTGQCAILTETECALQSGTVIKDKQLCSQVNCLGIACELNTGARLSADPALNNVPLDPNQGWRIMTSLFLHNGAIDAAVVLLIQFIVGNEIERTAGWLRVFFIYFGAGVGGVLVSSILNPYQVSAGAEPCLFGLLAVLIVDVSVLYLVFQLHSG